MNFSFQKIIQLISNPKIFVFTIIWLMILVFIGTIEQKDIGLFAAQNKYFSSVVIWFYSIPLPGGLLTMTIFVCLFLLSLKYGWRISRIVAWQRYTGEFENYNFKKEKA